MSTNNDALIVLAELAAHGYDLTQISPGQYVLRGGDGSDESPAARYAEQHIHILADYLADTICGVCPHEAHKEIH